MNNEDLRKILAMYENRIEEVEDQLSAFQIQAQLEKPYGRDLERILQALVFKLFLQDTAGNPDVVGGFQRYGDRLKWLNSVEVKTIAHLDDLHAGAALHPPNWFPQEATGTAYTFPTARKVSGTNKMGYVFTKAAKKGFMGEVQIPEVSLTAGGVKRNLRFYFEYGAAGDATDTTACFSMKYRIVPAGQDIASAEQVWIMKIEFPVVAGTSESVLKSVYTEIEGASLSDNCLIVIDDFWRNIDDAADDYTGDVVLMGTKVAWETS